MNVKKISVIFAISTLLSGCCPGPFCKNDGTTTYGVANNKWDVMSLDQRESAKEVYRLDQARLVEQTKLNTLHAQQSAANEQRAVQRKNELDHIEGENAIIRDQQRRVGNIAEREQLRQKQREQDLDSLKN